MRFLANHGGSKYLDIAAAVVTLKALRHRAASRPEIISGLLGMRRSPFTHYLEASLAALDLLKQRWGGTRQRSQPGIVLFQDRVGVLIDTRPRGLLEFCSRAWFTGSWTNAFPPALCEKFWTNLAQSSGSALWGSEPTLVARTLFNGLS